MKSRIKIIITIIIMCLFLNQIIITISTSGEQKYIETKSDNQSIIFNRDYNEYDNKYGIILAGNWQSQNQYKWFLQDTQIMYWTLSIKYGFKPDDTYILVTKSNEFNSPEIFDQNIIDYQSTKNNLENVLTKFKQGGEKEMGDNDLLFINIISHGNSEGFETKSDFVFADEFASFVNGINGTLVIILQPCQSGGLIDELSAENRVIVTSVKSTEFDNGFQGHFARGLIGISDIDQEIGNQDELTSIEEAYHYGAKKIYEKDGNHPLIDDNADKQGHHYSEEGYNNINPEKDGYNASKTFLGQKLQSNSPSKPETPDGSKLVKAFNDYEYKTSATDPDGDPILYGWDFDGDQQIDKWTSPHPSGMEKTIKNEWTIKGSYNIRVKSMDIHGYQSEWSDPLNVSISGKFYLIQLLQNILQNILDGYFFQLLFLILNIT